MERNTDYGLPKTRNDDGLQDEPPSFLTEAYGRPKKQPTFQINKVKYISQVTQEEDSLYSQRFNDTCSSFRGFRQNNLDKVVKIETTTKRKAFYPDLRTIKEFGLSDKDTEYWR